MRPLTAILAVLTGVAGWFYLFYSKAAGRLGGIEHLPSNLRRARLRRVNGFVMIVLAVLLYAGTYAVDDRIHPALFVTAWFCVTLLLGVVVLLVLADVRLTMRLRDHLARGRAPGPAGTSEPGGLPSRPEDADDSSHPGNT